MLSMVLQSSITAVSRQGSERGQRLNTAGWIGSLLKFLPPRVSRSDGLDSLPSELRIGVTAPKLALVLEIVSFSALDKCPHPQAHQTFIKLNKSFKELQDQISKAAKGGRRVIARRIAKGQSRITA